MLAFLCASRIVGLISLVPAAGRIGPVDPGDDRNPHLLQFGVPEEAGPLAATVGVDFFLFGQLHPGAVHEPHQRKIHDLRKVRHAEVVVRLAGNPRARDPFVVEPDEHAPFPRDPGQAVHHPGAARFLVVRVKDRVQRAESPRIDDILDPFPDRHLAPLVDQIQGNTHVLDPLTFGAAPARPPPIRRAPVRRARPAGTASPSEAAPRAAPRRGPATARSSSTAGTR